MRIHRRQLLCRCHTCFPLLRSRAKPEQSCCSFRAISSIFADGFAERADVKPGARYSQLPIHHLRVRILPPQPAIPSIATPTPGVLEKAANGGLSCTCQRVSDLPFSAFGRQIVESLRPTLRKLPFSGDSDWRLGSIATAA